MALRSAQEVIDALLSGARAVELQAEVEGLPGIELKSLMCSACSMREDVMANCEEIGVEVDRLLTKNCELHATNPLACKVAAVYRLQYARADNHRQSHAPVANTRAPLAGVERAAYTRNNNGEHVYKVTIQATSAAENNWRVVTAGTWTPGHAPQLEDHELSANILEALFDVIPLELVESGRNQVQDGDTSYAVVFRRLSR